MTRYLDKLEIGGLILVDPESNDNHNKEVPEYLGDGEFKIPGGPGYEGYYDKKIDNVWH